MGSPSYRSITGTLTYDPSSGQSCSLPGRISALIRAFLGRDNVRRKQQVSRSPSPRCPGSSAAFQGLGGAGLPPCLAGTLRSQGRLGKAAKLRGVRVNVLSLFSQTRQRFFCIFLSEKRPKPNKRGKKKNLSRARVCYSQIHKSWAGNRSNLFNPSLQACSPDARQRQSEGRVRPPAGGDSLGQRPAPPAAPAGSGAPAASRRCPGVCHLWIRVTLSPV